MNEQTRKLMAALLSGPDLWQSLRKDPVGTLSKVAGSEEVAPLRAIMKNAMANLSPLGDIQAPDPGAYLPEVVGPGRSAINVRTRSTGGEIPVASIVSLGVIMASVAVLGTVCTVAIAREPESGPGARLTADLR